MRAGRSVDRRLVPESVVYRAAGFWRAGRCVAAATLWCAVGGLAWGAAAADFQLPLPVDRADPGWTVQCGHVTWEDGCVVLQGGTRLLRRDYRFVDFVLEAEYQVRGAGSTGPVVCYRNTAGSATSALVGPSVRVGPVIAGRRGRRPAEYHGRAADARWHALRLSVIGQRVTVLVDGRHVRSWMARGPREGWFALGAAGTADSAVAWRNVRVSETGFRPLFNARDLTGWVGGGADASLCWTVEDGVLTCTGDRGPWLRSEQQHGDFRLRLEYRVGPGGNSGVYIRVPEDGNHHGPGAGIEVQILDDAADRYRDLQPYQFTGSLYAIVAAIPGSVRPAGQWNTLEIHCEGDVYRVTHNGHCVVCTSAYEYPELGERLRRGWIGLQNHNEPVGFRYLRIGPP